jgi:hypothetical protein
MSYVVIYKIAHGPFEIMVVTKKHCHQTFVFATCVSIDYFATYALNHKNEKHGLVIT